MLKRKVLFCFCFIFCSGVSFSQSCDGQFTQIQYDFTEEYDLHFGNAVRFNGGLDSLRLNLFKPIGDSNTNRPILVFVHGGGFYSGHRNDFNELCKTYAQRGYVTTTVSYRLGFNKLIFDYPFIYDQQEMIRAVYRGMQDVKGAIRFLKNRAEIDSSDVNSVAVIGASAGGFIALATAYLNLPDEKPTAAGNISPFVLEPRLDLGPIEGTLNSNGFDTEIRAVVNIFGALLDTSFVNSASDAAIFSYHQTQDPVVSCIRQPPYWPIPLVADNYPSVFGSCVMSTRFENLGFEADRFQTFIFDGNEHAVHDMVFVDSLIAEFLDNQFCTFTTSTTSFSSEQSSLRLYPNPTSSVLNIEATSDIKSIRIYNFTGAIIWNSSPIELPIKVDLNTISNGTYLLEVELENGQSLSRRFNKKAN